MFKKFRGAGIRLLELEFTLEHEPSAAFSRKFKFMFKGPAAAAFAERGGCRDSPATSKPPSCFARPIIRRATATIERFHRTLKEQAIRPKTPLSLEDAKQIAGTFIDRYNQVRLPLWRLRSPLEYSQDGCLCAVVRLSLNLRHEYLRIFFQKVHVQVQV